MSAIQEWFAHVWSMVHPYWPYIGAALLVAIIVIVVIDLRHRP